MTAFLRRAWVAYAAVALIALAALGIAAARSGPADLALTGDQRGRLLMHRGRPAEAARAFRDPEWRGVALFRAGDFKAAAQAFAAEDSADGAYNQGNALVMLGQYDDAVKRYDHALQLAPGWPAAETNRRIAMVRAERRKTQGGATGDPDSKPDDMVYDKTTKGGADTTVAGAPMSDEAVRAMWLKRVQTRPADFLRVRFARQLQAADKGSAGSGKP